MTQTPPPPHGAASNGPFVPQGHSATDRGLPPSGRGAAVWWVVAGVAALVILVLVVILLQGNRQPVPTPTPPPSESTVADPDGLGEFTPTYALRELSTLEFPKTFERYAQVSDYTGSHLRIADYEEADGTGAFTATVTLSTSQFAFLVQSLANPVLIGDAVCGVASEDAVNKECIMAGIEGPLSVGSAGESMTLEELARIIQAFYAIP